MVLQGPYQYARSYLGSQFTFDSGPVFIVLRQIMFKRKRHIGHGVLTGDVKFAYY